MIMENKEVITEAQFNPNIKKHCCPIKTGISIKSFSKPYFA